MTNSKPNNQSQSREFFTLGDHSIGNHYYQFRFDGKVYHILEQTILPSGEKGEEVLQLEESDSRKAYDAWNHIKRPERFGL